jgi:hypothetical protein
MPLPVSSVRHGRVSVRHGRVSVRHGRVSVRHGRVSVRHGRQAVRHVDPCVDYLGRMDLHAGACEQGRRQIERKEEKNCALPYLR